MKSEKMPAGYEAWRKIRGDWGNINPVTKVIPNKKKNRKIKHKKRDELENESN